MSLIIVEMGSGNTCRNNKQIVEEMIDEVILRDTRKHDVIFKWQLFNNVPPNVPLTRTMFQYAYHYAKRYGYDTTASVFDYGSLKYLETFNVPFVKIANNQSLYWLGHLSRNPVYISCRAYVQYCAINNFAYSLCCVSKYPATQRQYVYNFEEHLLRLGISDHTIGLDLYKKYQPAVWEKHFVLEHDDSNPDGGPFAITPEELGAIL